MSKTRAPERPGLSEAIDAAGGRRMFARALGVTEQAVAQWVWRGWVPSQRALEIEKRWGIDSCRTLRPDLSALIIEQYI